MECFFSIPTGTELIPIKLLHFKLTPKDADVAIKFHILLAIPGLISLICYHYLPFAFAFVNSMNDIIDKYSTHSKNLGKSHQQPSIDLNVCYV